MDIPPLGFAGQAIQLMLDQSQQDYDDVDSLLMDILYVEKPNYKRERKAAFKRVVSEVYSPPRVTAMAKATPSSRLIPGFALDLTIVDEFDGEPWDFTKSVKRRRALKLVDEQKPMMVIGSPACKAFCS